MRKNRVIICLLTLMTVMILGIYNVKAEESYTKCTYEMPSELRNDPNVSGVTFSYHIYKDRVEFKGFTNCGEHPFLDEDTACQKEGDEVGLNTGIRIMFDANDDKVKKEFYGKDENGNTREICPTMHINLFPGQNHEIGLGTGGDYSMNGQEMNFGSTVPGSDLNNNGSKFLCSYSNNTRIMGKVVDKVRVSFYYQEGGLYFAKFAFDEGSEKESTLQSNTALKDEKLIVKKQGYTIEVPPATLALFSNVDPNQDFSCPANLYLNGDDLPTLTIEQEAGTKSTKLFYKDESGQTPGGGNQNPNTGSNVEPGGATCESLLGEELESFLKKILTGVQIIGALLAIVLGALDFVGALLSGDADAIKKASKKLVVRISMAAVLIIIPAILKFTFDVFGQNGESFCILD